MIKPKISDFDNGDGTIDFEEYDEVMGDYEDTQYDEQKDREVEEDD